MRAISGSQNACYYELYRSIKGEGFSKRASCFNDHEDNHCLVLALTFPTTRDSCFNDYYIATKALVLHGLHKRKFPYALRYYFFKYTIILTVKGIFTNNICDLRRREFGKPKTLLRYFTLNYYLRQENILSMATICSTDMPA